MIRTYRVATLNMHGTAKCSAHLVQIDQQGKQVENGDSASIVYPIESAPAIGSCIEITEAEVTLP